MERILYFFLFSMMGSILLTFAGFVPRQNVFGLELNTDLLIAPGVLFLYLVKEPNIHDGNVWFGIFITNIILWCLLLFISMNIVNWIMKKYKK